MQMINFPSFRVESSILIRHSSFKFPLMVEEENEAPHLSDILPRSIFHRTMSVAEKVVILRESCRRRKINFSPGLNKHHWLQTAAKYFISAEIEDDATKISILATFTGPSVGDAKFAVNHISEKFLKTNGSYEEFCNYLKLTYSEERNENFCSDNLCWLKLKLSIIKANGMSNLFSSSSIMCEKMLNGFSPLHTTAHFGLEKSENEGAHELLKYIMFISTVD